MATLGKEVVACHDRVLVLHVTVTDRAHDQARQAAGTAAGRPAPDNGEVEMRKLAVYDRATGAA